MMKLSFSGVKEVDEKLRRLPLEFQHKIMLSVHHQAAKPMVEEIKQNAPVGRTGNLKKSIGSVSLGTPKRTGEIGAVIVGARMRSGYKGYHAHLVEFGTKPRKPGGWYAKFKNAKHTVMPAKPFFEPAYDRTKDEVISRISKAVVDKMYSYFRRKGAI